MERHTPPKKVSTWIIDLSGLIASSFQDLAAALEKPIDPCKLLEYDPTLLCLAAEQTLGLKWWKWVVDFFEGDEQQHFCRNNEKMGLYVFYSLHRGEVRDVAIILGQESIF